MSSGSAVSDVTEVIDLANFTKVCQPLGKLEFELHTGAAYGLLNNSYPIFCGGKSLGKGAYTYDVR